MHACKWVLNAAEKGTSWSFELIDTERLAEVPGWDVGTLKFLPGLAAFLGIQSLHIKDESRRCGLKSFKVLGAKWAMEKLGSGSSTVFAAATDGNHGVGVAWAARERGAKAIIWMPRGASPARVKAIQDLGAECRVTEWNYDDTLACMAAKAKAEGWELVQDTALAGYEKIPLWIMQGYTLIAREIIEAWQGPTPTHFLLQAGVGSFAGAMTAALIGAFPEAIFILVEPENAACFFRSFSIGRIEDVKGDLATIMACLACGRPNPLAWPILSACCAGAVACPDWTAACAMRMLWGNLPHDPRIEAGESGAAPLGALLWLMRSPEAEEAREAFALDSSSRVVLVNTEGATDPENFRKIVWGGAYPAPVSSPYGSVF